MFNLGLVFQALNSVFGRELTALLIDKAVTRVVSDNARLDKKLQELRRPLVPYTKNY